MRNRMDYESRNNNLTVIRCKKAVPVIKNSFYLKTKKLSADFI